MDIENIIIAASITIFALSLFIISLVSYKKYKNTKLLFVGGVFFIFFIRGILLSLEIFYKQVSNILSNPYFELLNLTILILLFIATLKR
jgi:hypothetical protein